MAGLPRRRGRGSGRLLPLACLVLAVAIAGCLTQGPRPENGSTAGSSPGDGPVDESDGPIGQDGRADDASPWCNAGKTATVRRDDGAVASTVKGTVTRDGHRLCRTDLVFDPPRTGADGDAVARIVVLTDRSGDHQEQFYYGTDGAVLRAVRFANGTTAVRRDLGSPADLPDPGIWTDGAATGANGGAAG